VIIDSHAHFDPRMLDVPRMLEKLERAGVDRVALIPCMNDPLPETPERLLAAARFTMRRRATRWLAERIHRLTLTKDGNLRLSGKVYGIYARPDNDSVVKVVAQHPDRFYGWMFLNPTAGVPVLDELERLRQVRGMIGIKLHPHWHDYRTELLEPLLTRAEELGLPVLIHLGFGPRGDFRAICARHPRLTVISAHAGFPFYRDLWRYRDECPNLHVDLSSPYINEGLARDAVRAMGPGRCLYGTDAPYGFHAGDGSYDWGRIKGWVDRLPVTSRDKDGIFGENFEKLLPR
jgi:predicted TIM-barrel fold metal-dependent hydrolase